MQQHLQRALGGRQGEKLSGLQLGQGLKALPSLVNWEQTCQHPRFPSQKFGARQRFAKVLICTCLGTAQFFPILKANKQTCFCVILDKIQSPAWSAKSSAVPNVSCLSSSEGARGRPQTGCPVGFGRAEFRIRSGPTTASVSMYLWGC